MSEQIIARELVDNLQEILEYDEDCFDLGEQMTKAEALILADRKAMVEKCRSVLGGLLGYEYCDLVGIEKALDAVLEESK